MSRLSRSGEREQAAAGLAYTESDFEVDQTTSHVLDHDDDD